MFDNSLGHASTRYHDFFSWVPRDLYRLDSDPEREGKAGTALVAVDRDLLALYSLSSGVRKAPTPVTGWYVLRWGDAGDLVAVETYYDQDKAIADAREALGDALFGDDPYDEADHDPATPYEVEYVEGPYDRVAEPLDDGTPVVVGLPFRAEHDGVQVAATTPEGARAMMDRMLARRAERRRP